MHIDVNGIKHAAEYLNSSKVKYDDEGINRWKWKTVKSCRDQFLQPILVHSWKN